MKNKMTRKSWTRARSTKAHISAELDRFRDMYIKMSNRVTEAEADMNRMEKASVDFQLHMHDLVLHNRTLVQALADTQYINRSLKDELKSLRSRKA